MPCPQLDGGERGPVVERVFLSKDGGEDGKTRREGGDRRPEDQGR
jgi:hypothetical protein